MPRASPVAIETPAFLHTDKAVDQQVRVTRDTDMGMRWDRLQWEAIRHREGEDVPGQFGEEWPEDGVNEEEWEKDRDQEWLFEWHEGERSGPGMVVGMARRGERRGGGHHQRRGRRCRGGGREPRLERRCECRKSACYSIVYCVFDGTSQGTALRGG
jgi:hypothetical protein